MSLKFYDEFPLYLLPLIFAINMSSIYDKRPFSYLLPLIGNKCHFDLLLSQMFTLNILCIYCPLCLPSDWYLL